MKDEVYLEKKTESGIVFYELEQEVSKSPSDKRDYKIIKLSNQLQALLISDPETDKSAAALDVHVGSQSNPVDLPGLAHFCEHLLFMGSKKYPNENEYSEYLSKHGGSCNAFTSYENTNYYFDVAPEQLDSALDRFSQVFIAPLFDPSCTEREIKAINSEFEKNLQVDSRRLGHIVKSQFRKDHPYSSFTTGNLSSLWTEPKARGIDVRDSLIKFYQKNYSANIMKLVVCGKESLQQLIDLVVSKFSDIVNLDIKPPNVPGSPFHEEMYNKVLNVVPTSDLNMMDIYFEIPNQYQNYQSKPSLYLGNLIGHEGPGSLLSLLKAKNWATALSSAPTTEYTEFTYLGVLIWLTPLGFQHREDIVYMFFQYIQLLKEQGIKEEIFNELQEISNLTFKFRQKFEVAYYVSDLAQFMHKPHPSHEVMTASDLYWNFDPQGIMEILDHLSPEKLLILNVSKSVQDMKSLLTEKWYGIQHKVEPLSSTLLAKLKTIELNPCLALPLPNPFIPKNLNVVDTFISSTENPVVLAKDSSGCLLYQMGSFEIPRVHIHIHLKNHYVNSTPRLFGTLELLCSLITENLNEYSYDAKLANAFFRVEASHQGITIFVWGYSDKIEALLTEILNHLINLEISEDVFHTWKDELLLKYDSTKVSSPLYLSDFYCSFALAEKEWAYDEKRREVLTLTKEEVQTFAKSFMSRLYVEALVVGNVTPTDSLKLMDRIRTQIDFSALSRTELVGLRSVMLPGPTCELIFTSVHPNPEDVNSGITFYLSLMEADNYENRAYAHLIKHMLEEPAFNQLRTVEQLGYLVKVATRCKIPSTGVSINIQSNQDPIFLESRIESFLKLFLEQVENLENEEFLKHIQSLRTLLLKKDDNLSLLAFNSWASIFTGEYDFDANKEIAKALEIVEQSKVVKLIEDYVVKGGSKRKKMSFHICSQKLENNKPEILSDKGEYTLSDCGKLIEDLALWKNEQKLTRASVAVAPQAVFPLE